MSPRNISNFWLIIILGSLTALSPFAIDMYLPAFPLMAKDLNTTVSQVSLSLSSYFIGLAIGQLMYGPVLDRYGRKRPLYFGFTIFLLTTVACMLSKTVETLIVIRLMQSLGVCVAGVASIAMVRDFFGPKESGKVFSLLILILGTSPLVAPTAGGYLAEAFGWQSIFAALGLLGLAILSVVHFFLPESHQPDPTQSLKPGPIFKNYLKIIRNGQFITYTMTGALIFAGMFVYLGSSPAIFMEYFQLTPQQYGWIFATLAAGFIGASQLNIYFLRLFKNERILRAAVIGSVIVSFSMLIGAWNGWLGFEGVMVVLFLLLAGVGLTNPNASALAMAPYSKHAGSASALMGSLQMGVGALAMMAVSLLKATDILTVAVIFCVTSVLSLSILIFGTRALRVKVEADPNAEGIVAH
ncbi:multidrug effflux MFS transporter [Bdellovibrio sp. HCB209]|uniref:multidrug effflux MFS transporter n=1 Tax=Bdellovibrio sp. HCB209 TaxID=3394354 RepID=UPI0039B6C700